MIYGSSAQLLLRYQSVKEQVVSKVKSNQWRHHFKNAWENFSVYCIVIVDILLDRRGCGTRPPVVFVQTTTDKSSGRGDDDKRAFKSSNQAHD